MNKTLKMAVAATFAMATSAAAQWEWNLADDGGQVTTGGYWFTYADEKEGYNSDGSKKPEASLDATPKAGDGYGKCSSTNFPQDDGEGSVNTEWLDMGGTITYTFDNYDPGCTYLYRFAGVGFNWFHDAASDGVNKITVAQEGADPTGGATSITVKYKLDEVSTGVKCYAELAADGATKYDNFMAQLKSGDQSAGLNLPFSGFTQEGWGTKTTWDIAFQASEGIKFKCSAGAASTGVKSAKLTFIGVSFGGNVPILNKSTVAGLNMIQSGRILSISVDKASSVQVLNLQGAVVHSQTLQPNGKVNLSSLPTGIYMVRIPSLGYTSRVLLK